MSHRISGRRHAQAAIVSVFSTMLVLSLACSESLQQGHADAPIANSAAETEPLQVGQGAPKFVVKTVDGDPFIFDPESLERPVILITFRGGWCPYCNTHLSELRTVMPEIESLGLDVLFLSGDRPDLLYKSLEGDTQTDIADLGYQIYSDADARAAIALGIAFRASDRTISRRHEKGQDIVGSSMLRHGVLPVPAVYAIDSDGIIAFAFVEPDYKVRLPADDLLQVARDIVQ